MPHYAALPRAVALALPITLGAWTVQAADLIQTAEQDGLCNDNLRDRWATMRMAGLSGQSRRKM